MLNDEVNNHEEETTNEIVEIEENDEINNTRYDISMIKEEIPDKKKKEKREHKPLTKKQKTTIIVICSILLVIFLGIIIYFLVFKKDKPEEKNNEPIVLIEKDNYTYSDGKLIFKDEDKKNIGEYTCRNTNEEYCYVAYYSNEDDFDISSKVYEDGKPILNRSDILFDNYVFIYDNNIKENGNIILYDIKEEKELGAYKLVKEIDSESVIVKDTKDIYNVLTFTKNSSEELLKDKYDYIGYIIDTDALVVANNKNYKLLDMDGKSITSEVPGEIKVFDDDSLSVLSGNNKYVYDYKGNKKIDTGYDYIRFVDSYILALDGKKMYVYDKDGNVMNIDALKINSTDYNTKLLFNDELRQTGKETAFEAYINGGTLKVEVDGEIKQLNLYEGRLSKDLELINYFDGKLYFYSDEDKTKLIGSYTCTNKNVVNSDTSTLNNCYLATEDYIVSEGLGDQSYMPIYNKTFAFISDVATNSTNKNIVVWNLKTNKKMVAYQSVDAGFHQGEKDVNLIDTAGTLLVAKNSNDSYGVVNIGTSSISGVISFSDEAKSYKNIEIKYLGTDYLFKRSDNTYHLYDTKGNEITKDVSTTSEIINYNSKYILVKNAYKYMIYSLNGSIISDEFKYIAMENTYYIGVNSDGYLGIYTYDSKNNLLEDEVSIGDTNYEENISYSLSGNTVKVTYTDKGEEKSISVRLG